MKGGTVSINKQSGHRIQAIMTDKDTGNLYVGRMDSTNKIVGWKEIVTKDYVDSKIADLQAQINALK